jgi:hypothetical protein
MKTRKENWKALKNDKLSEMSMIKLRGGDGEDDPVGPIIKRP